MVLNLNGNSSSSLACQCSSLPSCSCSSLLAFHEVELRLEEVGLRDQQPVQQAVPLEARNRRACCRRRGRAVSRPFDDLEAVDPIGAAPQPDIDVCDRAIVGVHRVQAVVDVVLHDERQRRAERDQCAREREDRPEQVASATDLAVRERNDIASPRFHLQQAACRPAARVRNEARISSAAAVAFLQSTRRPRARGSPRAARDLIDYVNTFHARWRIAIGLNAPPSVGTCLALSGFEDFTMNPSRLESGRVRLGLCSGC